VYTVEKKRDIISWKEKKENEKERRKGKKRRVLKGKREVYVSSQS
jgi:hypothetical protein